MNSTEALALIISAIVVPILVSVVSNPSWSGNAKRVLITVVGTVLGALTAIIAGDLGVPESWRLIIEKAIVNAGVVILASQGVYQLFKPYLSTTGEAVAARRGLTLEEEADCPTELKE